MGQATTIVWLLITCPTNGRSLGTQRIRSHNTKDVLPQPMTVFLPVTSRANPKLHVANLFVLPSHHRGTLHCSAPDLIESGWTGEVCAADSASALTGALTLPLSLVGVE